jgi:Uma2 family endonuclease
MVQTLDKILTLEEFLQLPETKPASQYINGQIIQKPMPQGKHSRIQGKLVSVIENLVTESSIALALPELRCTFGERSIVPDVVVLRWDRIPRDENGDIANICLTYPDWTIEILSPNQNPIKVMGNIFYCLDHGSNLGWLIDPETKSVLVFFPQQQPLLIESPEDILPIPEFIPELKLTVGDVFNWLKL